MNLVTLHPSLLFIGGAVLIPFFKNRAQRIYLLLLPLIAFATLISLDNGDYWRFSFISYHLSPGHLDNLSRIFLYIFSMITFIAVLFALNSGNNLQFVSAFIYAGGALGVTLAGDFFTLYVFWEIMAIASTFLILARKTAAARRAGFRYVLVHLFGGLCLLGGIMLYIRQTGSIALAHLELNHPAAILIFIGVALNAAVPPLHAWLKDAYPEATVAGAVFLSAFTTKSAVYIMARLFAGTPILIYIGACMTIFPIFYAVLENDIRRVLSYSLINQVGFMLCGVGIGTNLAINGTVAHAFCHILYKALLFMATGSVLYQTGKIRCTDLGGLYKTMPLTAACCIIASASISGFPLFSGFVSKSMIITEAGNHHLVLVWFFLLFASAGVVDHAGIKVPYFTFFGHDSGLRSQDPPWNMRAAMVITAFLCVFIGIFPKPLYDILPYPVEYVPYTPAHVVSHLQLLCFGALAFCLLILSGIYPAEIRAINLDTDWFYIKGGRGLFKLADTTLNGINRFCENLFAGKLIAFLSRISKNAPAVWTLFFIMPIRSLMFRKKDDQAGIKESVYAAFASATIPIGISAAMAALLIVIIFALC